MISNFWWRFCGMNRQFGTIDRKNNIIFGKTKVEKFLLLQRKYYKDLFYLFFAIMLLFCIFTLTFFMFYAYEKNNILFFGKWEKMKNERGKNERWIAVNYKAILRCDSHSFICWAIMKKFKDFNCLYKKTVTKHIKKYCTQYLALLESDLWTSKLIQFL